MASRISKTTLEHLAKLARIDLGEHEEEKILHDLERILEHFDELKSVESSSVNYRPHTTDAFRDDTEHSGTNLGKGVAIFPKSHEGSLVVPPVFE